MVQFYEGLYTEDVEDVGGLARVREFGYFGVGECMRGVREGEICRGDSEVFMF